MTLYEPGQRVSVCETPEDTRLGEVKSRCRAVGCLVRGVVVAIDGVAGPVCIAESDLRPLLSPADLEAEPERPYEVLVHGRWVRQMERPGSAYFHRVPKPRRWADPSPPAPADEPEKVTVECADPVVLAEWQGGVAGPGRIQWTRFDGVWRSSYCTTAVGFAADLANDCSYRLVFGSAGEAAGHLARWVGEERNVWERLTTGAEYRVRTAGADIIEDCLNEGRTYRIDAAAAAEVPDEPDAPWVPKQGDWVMYGGQRVVVTDTTMVEVRQPGSGTYRVPAEQLSPVPATEWVKWWKVLGRSLPDGRRICSVCMEDDDRNLYVNVHGTESHPDADNVKVPMDGSRVEVLAAVASGADSGEGR